ncbi:hypothetical protein ACFFMN_12010 [Planobispora siamensis]|uniref:hypothetical protein n=1 Tax=Planobispora siamensis TaxID=936338 RepID=UPI0019526DA3|nr:hypothetical protein [Planobispora siamensis]
MSPLSARDRADLNRRFRDAIRIDRDLLCQGNKETRKHLSQDENASYGIYAGGWLSWPHLADMIYSRLHGLDFDLAWERKTVLNVLKTGDKALPRDPYQRQVFLEAVQTVMNHCFDIEAEKRRLRASPHRYVSLFLGTPPTETHFQPFGFDPASVGFFRIIDWNFSRRLDQQHNIGPITVVSSMQQDWVDPAALQVYLEEESAKPGSPCPTLVAYDEDTRESANQQLCLSVARSQYYEHVAIRRYLRDHPEDYHAIVARILRSDQEGGLSKLIRGAPNSNIVVNVTVQSRNGRIMMIRRPQGARVWPHFYQVGVHETMNWREPGRPFENCYDLAVRALVEEVNLTEPDLYGDNIVFSWFGLYAVEVSAYFFAHVKTKLEEGELVERAQRAHSAYEIEEIDWYDLSRDTVKMVLSTWQDGPWNSSVDDRGRRYLPHATMSLTQLYRVSRQGML